RVHQKQRAVMAEVITEKPVGNGGLRRDGTERGMGVDGSYGGVEAAVGDAPQADAPVIAGDTLDEIVDGIVGIGTLVDVLGLERVDELGANVDEDAFGMAHTAHILIGEDIAILNEFRRAPVTPEFVRAVRPRAGGPSF